MLKKLILSAGICFILFSSGAQTLRTPAPSPTQTVRQDFGVGAIELSYSRPGVKGRKIFGDVVPFGKVWRTGANSATTLTFSDSVTIGGTAIAPGKYGLLTIPGNDEWTVILTKQTDVTSPAAYKQNQDVVRIPVKPIQLPFSIETFTISFNDLTSTSCKLEMMWDNQYIQFPITTSNDNKIMAQLRQVMDRDNRPYFNAAMYYVETGRDLNQAIVWFDKAIEQNPEGFFIYYQKANALAKLGKKDEARKVSQKSMELATAQKNDDYVTLNKKLLAQLN